MADNPTDRSPVPDKFLEKQLNLGASFEVSLDDGALHLPFHALRIRCALSFRLRLH